MRMTMLLALVIWPTTIFAQSTIRDPDYLCAADEVRCLEEDQHSHRGDPCSFVYIKRSAWFGFGERWHVYSSRGGPTLSLRDFEVSQYVHRRDGVRSTSFIADLLDGIGATELRLCDVEGHLQCVDREHRSQASCRRETFAIIAKWQRERMTPEELRNLHLLEMGR